MRYNDHCSCPSRAPAYDYANDRGLALVYM